MERTLFKCTVDRKNRIVTTVVILPIVVIAAAIWLTSPGDSGGWLATIVLPAIMGITAAVVYGNLPREMAVTGEAIALICPFRTKIILRNAETEVRRVRDTEMQGLWRKCGSDGVFGKWGLFASKRYPRIHFYAKRSRRDWILVKSAGKVYVLAPDDPDAFLELFS